MYYSYNTLFVYVHIVKYILHLLDRYKMSMDTNKHTQEQTKTVFINYFFSRQKLLNLIRIKNGHNCIHIQSTIHFTCAHTLKHMHIQTHIHMHACTHIYSHIPYTHVYTNALAATHVHTYIHTYTQMYIHTNIHIYTHRATHTVTFTHTH